jgi:hypothetical protein
MWRRERMERFETGNELRSMFVLSETSVATRKTLLN